MERLIIILIYPFREELKMELANYDVLVEKACALSQKAVVAVAGAADSHAIEAVLEVYDRGVADPYLVGDTAIIKEILRSMDRNPTDFRITDAIAGMNEAETAVEIIKSGEAGFLMKGMMETTDVLRPVVKKENGLRTGRGMSHLGFNSFKGYHKIICVTDAGMVPHPTLEQKRDILHNAIDAFHRLGYDEPKAACLCCKETVDQKIIETVEARALREMAENGDFGKCFVEGPISYDIAMNAEIAAIKHFDCPHSGNFDILMTHDIHCGNVLVKSWLMHLNSTLAGIIMGARIPIVLTSRGSTPEEKFCSLAMAAVLAGGNE